MSSHLHYPSFAKSERKDALVPDSQEYDMSDPDRADEADMLLLTTKDRLALFERLAANENQTSDLSKQREGICPSGKWNR